MIEYYGIKPKKKKTTRESDLECYGTIENEYFEVKKKKYNDFVLLQFKINIFDCTKRYFLLDNINDNDKLTFLLLYKESIINVLYRDKPKFTDENQINLKEVLICSLRQYITDKFRFKKEKYVMNPKYYPVSSKINKEDLIYDLDEGVFDYNSITKRANEIGVSYSTLYNNITEVLGYKRIGIDQINSKRMNFRNQKIMTTYLLKKYTLFKDSFTLIYIDESSFNNHKRKRKKWVKKAHNNHFLDNGRIKSMSLILAVSNKKVMNFFLNKKANNAHTFKIFLKNLHKSIISSKTTRNIYESNKICLLMDNATIHKTDLVKDYLKSTKFNVIYLPPYYPDLNSAEFAFRNMKIKFYKRNILHQ